MLKIGKPRTSKGLATFCARIADEKLARNILIIDLTKIETAPTSFFVICTCDSENQSLAIAEAIVDMCRQLEIQKPRLEGIDSRQWILLDFFDVVVHVMLQNIRDYYKIERLWGDGRLYSINESGRVVAFSLSRS